MSLMLPHKNLKTLNKPFEERFRLKFDLFLDKGGYIPGEEVFSFEKGFAQCHDELLRNTICD